MKKAIFCGTFNPFTLGHLDILHKSREIFDKIYIAVPSEGSKSDNVPIESRLKIVRKTVENCLFAEVISFSGGMIDLCKTLDTFHLVRGIRNPADFIYEYDLLRNYKTQSNKIECAYFMPDARFAHISSSVVRELVRIGGNIENHIYAGAIPMVIEAYRSN